jgi:hypothetical protein
MTVRRERQARAVVVLVGAALALAGVTAGARMQKLSPAEAATRLSGTWVLNKELTSGFKAPGGRRGGGRGGGLRMAMAPAYGQRGTGGSTASDASDLSAAEVAAMAAMRELQQLAEVITIKATPEQVTFEDARGQRTYGLDGKTVKITVSGAEVSTKSKWDKAVLKQEFSTASSKLTETWDIDENGRLVLIAKVESLRLITPDQKAVFDRKQNP